MIVSTHTSQALFSSSDKSKMFATRPSTCCENLVVKEAHTHLYASGLLVPNPTQFLFMEQVAEVEFVLVYDSGKTNSYSFISLIVVIEREMMQIRAEIGAVVKADGSALFEMGNTKVIAAVYGHRELHLGLELVAL
ncbi:Exoribonuclease, phosphorolytic domain 1 [Dillenia turbinata]|uniref:Exoribonuclease, phosphorolytic domain 1 n=1 Tax=Dillenia turbinata TaxID=194707 RepID=A0AAN8YYM7_9MAGN